MTRKKPDKALTEDTMPEVIADLVAKFGITTTLDALAMAALPRLERMDKKGATLAEFFSQLAYAAMRHVTGQ